MRKLVLFTTALTIIVTGIIWNSYPSVRFLAGGAMVNLGYRFQDQIGDYDFKTDSTSILPNQVWKQFLQQNSHASLVRTEFPRASRHPLIAMIVCMDARIDTSELVGDTRKNYYLIRTAGSVMSSAEIEMLELAVDNGVKVVVITRHTDCAAEKVASDPQRSLEYPELTKKVKQREEKVREFLDRPKIASKIAEGKLIVREMLIDTHTHKLLEVPTGDASVASSTEE